VYRLLDPSPAIDGTFETETIYGLDRPVKRDPSHHLRVGELLARTSDFPNSLVGLAPATLQRLEQILLE
jgi:hypothetical protein